MCVSVCVCMGGGGGGGLYQSLLALPVKFCSSSYFSNAQKTACHIEPVLIILHKEEAPSLAR